MRKVRRGIEAVYGGIIIAVLISMFIGFYVMILSNQEESYKEIIGSLERERVRNMENIELSKSNNSLILYSTTGSRIIMIIARGSDKTYYLDLRENPLEVPENSYRAVPYNISEWIRSMWSEGFKIYFLTSLGNMIDLSSYLSRIYNGGDTINTVESGGCFYYDFVFEACKDCYYIVLGTWRAYIPSTTSPITFYEIPVYAWDINKSYTILKSPYDTLIYLRKISDNPPTSYPVLSTSNWFNPPSILNHPNPWDMSLKFSVNISYPWNISTRFILGGGRTNVTYIYNGSIVVTADVYWIYPSGGSIDFTTKNYGSYNTTYSFLVAVYDNYNWNVTLSYRVVVDTYRAEGLYYDRIVTNTRSVYYQGYYITLGDMAGVKYLNPNVISITNITGSVNFTFYSEGDAGSGVLEGRWDNIVRLTIYIDPSVISLSNTTIYRPDASGYITASNGYRIKEIITRISFSNPEIFNQVSGASDLLSGSFRNTDYNGGTKDSDLFSEYILMILSLNLKALYNQKPRLLTTASNLIVIYTSRYHSSSSLP
ncbi:MAG: hypothetical protein QXU60_02765 [Sulfolobales archaeon]